MNLAGRNIFFIERLGGYRAHSGAATDIDGLFRQVLYSIERIKRAADEAMIGKRMLGGEVFEVRVPEHALPACVTNNKSKRTGIFLVNEP